MEKQNHYRFLLNNINVDTTAVENIFITEYMPGAQGAYVKVYLYGLMTAKNPNAEPVSNEILAELFEMTVGDVINAWQYWKDQGILDVKISGRNLSDITFYHIGECLIHGKPSVKKKKSADVYDQNIERMFEQIQNMYGSRAVSKGDMQTFTALMSDYGFTPEVIVLLVEYALNMLDKKADSYTEGAVRNYIKAVAKGWYEAGVRTFEDAERWQKENRERTKYHYDILRALGIRRGASDPEKKMMDIWRNEYRFSKEMIDFAISRATTPNVRYVNAILKNWFQKGWQDPETVQRQEQNVRSKQAVKQQDVCRLSDEDKEAYNRRAQADEDWFNNIEEEGDGEVNE